MWGGAASNAAKAASMGSATKQCRLTDGECSGRMGRSAVAQMEPQCGIEKKDCKFTVPTEAIAD